jgi:hypothetical protein
MIGVVMNAIPPVPYCVRPLCQFVASGRACRWLSTELLRGHWYCSWHGGIVRSAIIAARAQRVANRAVAAHRGQ